MAIAPIDNAMMLAQTANVAKDSHAQMKKTELMQDFAAIQADLLAKHEKNRVGSLTETEAATLRADKDRHQSGGEQAEADGERREEEETDDGLLADDGDWARFVLETNKQIDIKG